MRGKRWSVLLGLAMTVAAALAPTAGRAQACTPIGPLPPPGASDAALAAYVRPFAALAAFVEVDTLALVSPEKRAEHPLPNDFTFAFDAYDLFAEEDPEALLLARLSGIHAEVFIHCGGDLVVIDYRGMQIRDLRQYVTVIIRRMLDEPPLAMRFSSLVLQRFPGANVLQVGHSGGGGMAIYTGWALNIPTIAFNPVRPRYDDGLDGGPRSINVIVRGDFLADPTMEGQAAPPGRTLWLDPGDTPWRHRHDLETVLRSLDAMLN